jgi:L-alanine-DL-glutamate epimerase-like enolase superfamily enzyme
MADDLVVTPLAIENGEMKVSNLPGVGIQLDELKLAHYKI